MEIKQNIDESEWNQFIKTEGVWNFFQSFSWGEVQKRLGVEVIRLGLIADNHLVALAQILITRAKRGTFLHIRQGPVFKSTLAANSTYWKFLLQHLIELAHQKKAWFVRVAPMVPNSYEYQALLRNLGLRPAPIHAMDGEYAWVLGLESSEEVLFGGMRKTTRYLIRQAQKLGVAVEESTRISDFLDLYAITSKRHGFVPHVGLSEEFSVFSENKQASLLLAKHNGQLLSGALIIYFNSQAIYHHGASLLTKIPASYLLQWEAIKRAKKRGMKVYNFWGIAPTNSLNHPWKGITLFKQGFGGRTYEFIHAHDLPTSRLYGISYSIELARKLKKGY